MPKESEDPYVPRTVSYSHYDTQDLTSRDARSEMRHHIKHLGMPQQPIDRWRYKKAYDLIQEAMDGVFEKRYSAAQFILLFTNRLHIFHEEYPDSRNLVETTRMVIVLIFFVDEEEDMENVRDYFDGYYESLMKMVTAWEQQ